MSYTDMPGHGRGGVMIYGYAPEATISAAARIAMTAGAQKAILAKRPDGMTEMRGTRGRVLGTVPTLSYGGPDIWSGRDGQG